MTVSHSPNAPHAPQTPHTPTAHPQSAPVPGSGSNGRGDGSQLIELLSQQQVLYKAILRLGSQQSELVAKADAEALLNHLSQRQHLVDRLGQLNQKIAPYRQDWRKTVEALPSDQQDAVSQLVEQARESLAAIIAQDDSDRQTLEQAKAAMGTELNKVNKAGLAAAAYGGNASRPNPRFTNHQG